MEAAPAHSAVLGRDDGAFSQLGAGARERAENALSQDVGIDRRRAEVDERRGCGANLASTAFARAQRLASPSSSRDSPSLAANDSMRALLRSKNSAMASVPALPTRSQRTLGGAP